MAGKRAKRAELSAQREIVRTSTGVLDSAMVSSTSFPTPSDMLPKEAASIDDGGHGLEGNEDYRAFIDRLAESNVDEYVDLPMIAVMGDTSSGKSSLLSMISLIELPSSDELTTRCPIKLAMSRSNTLSATVEVVWKDKPNGKTDAEIAFSPIRVDDRNWGDLTDSIAQAQKHIVDLSGKEVARDVVSVKISSPYCENLTLIDLPGIVRATGKGESEHLATDIQSLINDYLKNPRCVILAVHPSNVDFHNSQIMADARKVDPMTKRTIPVLTKPDLIDKGAEKNVRDLLLGLKTERFEKGFHMIKGRSQASLIDNETITDGLDKEEAWFRNNQPWRDVDDKNLFGTKNLRMKLSLVLMQLIRSSFPSIMKEMKELKANAGQQYTVLGTVPESLSEKRMFFMQVKDVFIKSLRPLLLGGEAQHLKEDEEGGETEKCAAYFHQQSDEFKTVLHKSNLANIADIRVGGTVIAVDSSDKQEYHGKVSFLSETDVYLRGVPVTGTARISTPDGRSPDDVWTKMNKQIFQAQENGTSMRLYPFPRDNVRRDPSWILKQIKRHRPMALPVFVNSDLFDSLIAHFIESQWTNPCLKLVEDISSHMLLVIHSHLDDNGKLQRFPKLTFYVKQKVESVIEALTEGTLKTVTRFIHAEKSPYSQDHYLFENIKRMRNKNVKDELVHLARGSTFTTEATVVAMIEGVFKRNQKKSIDEHMSEEMMHVMGAYGKVSLKRFCDTVPMHCSAGLLQSFSEAINNSLSAVSDAEVEKLLRPAPDEQIQRKNLKVLLERLENGMAAFMELS